MKKNGFTLIEISVVLALIGIILYGSMRLLVTGVQTSQVNSTVTTMDAIEKALLDYRVAFGRIPCPSDLTATASSANYGVEAANTGTCTGGSPAANFAAASGTVEGGIPTRALRLPDSYMVDGWGRKFRYAVNPDYTVTSTTNCTLTGSVSTPGITVNDASGAARSTTAIYVIVSHGANGHGAYSSGGIAVNAKSTNADEQANCHCDNSAAHTGGAGILSPVTYVQKAPTIATAGSLLTGFDDIVTYKEFWQMMTPSLSTNTLGCAVPPTYYRTVTLDHTKVGTVNNTDQSSFPVLFVGTATTTPYLATTGHGGMVTNASGYDITFTSDAAGTHLLPFERESWNATTGAAVFWVQVPTVSHTTDTVIYLQYGNTAITTDQSNQHGTWNNTYKGVWHLGESSGSVLDSTSYGSIGTKLGTVTQGASGIFGNAISISGNSSNTNYIDIPNPADHHLDFGTGSFTQSCWVNIGSNPTSYFDMIWKGGSPSSVSGYNLFASADPPLYYGSTVTDASSHGYDTAETYQTLSTWYHVVMTVDTTAHRSHIYFNGAEYGAPGTSISPLGNTTSTSDLIIGTSDNPNTVTNAKIQEVHIVNGAESADWIKTEYNNQSAPDKATSGASGFYTVGTAVSR